VLSKVRTALRVAHTVRHLQPEQVTQRALRRMRAARGPAAAPAGLELGGDGRPRVQRCRRAVDPRLLDGEFEFWGVRRRLPLDRAWLAADLGLSWNYPVHYHDALPALAESPDAATRTGVLAFVDAWIGVHPPGSDCAWDPYPTALRIVNWFDVLSTLGADAPAAWRSRVVESVWLQAAWLERRLERHLLGTHLLKDAKALAIAGAAFGDAPAAARWRRGAHAILRRELARQVRADGGHVEPSIAYHALALEDVLDLLAFGIGAGTVLGTELAATAARMLDYLAVVQTPAGGVPLLGDAGADASPLPAALFDFAARLGLEVRAAPDFAKPTLISSGAAGASGGVTWLPESGIAVYRDAHQYLLADVAGIGPSHLSAHGHCDSLSFEWWVDGVPIVVDTGTTSYEVGPLRDACRATHAHNTLEIDGREQHEIWAAFRVARRARVHARRDESTVTATLRPWHDRRVRVERRFEFSTGGVFIRDRVEGPSAHTVASRLHLHPDCELRREGSVLHVRHGRATAAIELDVAFEVHAPETGRSVHCERLGVATPNTILEMAAARLPWSAAIRLRRE
jgi:uncharacterized heparinase superfamily protein